MTTHGDAGLAALLHRHVTDIFEWLGHYPADEVDPAALASIRQSLAWLVARSPDPAALTTAAGLLVEVTWWLDTSDDDEIDPDVASKVLEEVAGLSYEMSAEQTRRLVDVLGELAAAEGHAGRRYQLRFFPFAIGLVDEEADEPAEPPVTGWVRPEDRAGTIH